MKKLLQKTNLDQAAASTTLRTAKAPVPLSGVLPTTILAEGPTMLSKSPRRAASATKLAVVSKEALRKGEELFERPVRLKGLYPPSDV